MTEQEILDKVATEGWTIIETKTLGQEGTGDNLLVIKGLLLCKPQNSFMLRQWVNYYLKIDGSCYWREYDPFPAPHVATFSQEVNAKIVALVAAGTIKAGYVERSDMASQTALVVAIKPDNSLAMYHVCKVGEELTITAITGTYPI